MNFIIYDIHGLPVYGLNVEPVIDRWDVQKYLDSFLKEMKRHGADTKDFNIDIFRAYLYSKTKARSCPFEFTRAYIREVEDARVE